MPTTATVSEKSTLNLDVHSLASFVHRLAPLFHKVGTFSVDVGSAVSVEAIANHQHTDLIRDVDTDQTRYQTIVWFGGLRVRFYAVEYAEDHAPLRRDPGVTAALAERDA
jgi:hypothetical protein